MFNEKNPSVRMVGENKIYSGDFSYITSVKWSDFTTNIEKAYSIKENKNRYIVSTQVGI